MLSAALSSGNGRDRRHSRDGEVFELGFGGREIPRANAQEVEFMRVL